MFAYLEVQKHDPRFEWIEISSLAENDEAPFSVRLVVGEAHEMVANFIQRFMARREGSFPVPEAQRNTIEELFEEACMARVLLKSGGDSPDLIDLFPTSVLYFKYPEKTSFRKSRAARIKMFLDEGYSLLQAHEFEAAMKRLDWVHHLDVSNVMAYELKLVCLRSWKKMAECIPVFENWIEAHPDDLAPRFGIGEMWLYLEQYVRARERFEEILQIHENDCMALIGLAQAKLKLGENPIDELRKAWLKDSEYTVNMVEHHFDFRGRGSSDLRPLSLEEIAKTYQIPLKRILERACNGVFPMAPPDESGLLRFSKNDMDRYYEVLKLLGLEIDKNKFGPVVNNTQDLQPGLFDE